ncbi:MAG: hypothetical protein EPN74_07050 [Rhodanobacter sp.]|nr:MAG: hypothetical protein EPN74_07050 [Rhodanobacter sp.]
MRRVLAVMVLVAAAATLSGCYYDPGYSYVRASGEGGDAYYGRGTTTVYDDGYYANPYYYGSGYYPGYYGGGYYGCCYNSGVSIGIHGRWRDRPHDRRDGDGYRGHEERHREYAGHEDRRGGTGDHREGRRRRHGDHHEHR